MRLRARAASPGSSQDFISICFVLCLCLFVLATLPGFSQDIEPRRWSHLPLGSSFGGLAYAYTEDDISFNPVLRIENGEFALNTAIRCNGEQHH